MFDRQTTKRSRIQIGGGIREKREMCLDVVLPGHDRAAGGDEARQSELAHTLKSQEAKGEEITGIKTLIKARLCVDQRSLEILEQTIST